MLEHIKIIIQYLLPKRCLTVFAGFLARRQLGFFTTWMITLFVKLYRIDMQEAQTPDVESFSTFNAFFTRHLKEGARPIEAIENTLCFPADGVISQLGKINGDQLIQAKGHEYSLDALLACNTLLVEQFTSGYFITIYLSPKDYHRVHMPCAGTLREMIYVPGALFSVNHATARHIPDLFARNERVICIFDTEFGKMVQILVGATIVGSISTAWHGEVTPPRQGVLQRWVYPAEGEKAIHLEKGEEMGFFQLGSTVINLFPKDTVRFSDELMPLMVTRMGEYFADEEIKFKSESAQVNE